MAHRTEPAGEAGRPAARRPVTGPLRLLLAVTAALAFVAYLVPFCDAALSHQTHPLDRARGIPLERYLQADHDLSMRRNGLPRPAGLPADPEPAWVSPPAPPEAARFRHRDDPGWRSLYDRQPQLSRGPPGR